MPLRPSLRRPVPRDEPFDRGATAARRSAILGVVIAAAAVLCAQRHLLPPAATALLLVAALGFAFIAIAGTVLAAVRIWRSGDRGLGRCLLALALALALLGDPARIVAGAAHASFQSEMSTDEADPPRFSLSRKALAARQGTLVPWRFGRDPLSHGPDPVTVDRDSQDAYAAVLGIAATLRWRVVDAVPPGGRSGLGHVDAVVESPLLRWPVDVAVRITPLAAETRIDLRAVSRLGLPDGRALAAAIKAMTDALEAQDSES